MWRRVLHSRRLHVVGFALIVALFLARSIEFQTDSRPTAPPSDLTTSTGSSDPGAYRPDRSRRGSPPFDSFAGSRACEKCHRSVYDSFVETHHHLTSNLPAHDRFFGSFSEGENIVDVTNTPIYFKMEKTEEGFYVNQFSEDSEPHRLDLGRKVELVIGSGKFGHTYLYWIGTNLYRMPIGLYQGQWIYDIDRKTSNAMTYRYRVPVSPRCLECHTTFFEAQGVRGRVRGRRWYVFDTERYLLGVGCEKCHGPGRAHIDRHETPDIASTEPRIINPARFDRTQRMDLCSQCHAGEGRALRPAFSYVPGEPLDRYMVFEDETLWTHANHAILFRQSECFKKSDDLTCVDCHDVHRNERGGASLHSARCLSCHADSHRREMASPDVAVRLRSNCIDCHMPLQESRNVVIRMGEHRIVYPRIRNHRIAIYK